jgi:hypothetical protein
LQTVSNLQRHKSFAFPVMKTLSIISIATMLLFACSNNDGAYDNNKGGQADQDAPSNRDRDVETTHDSAYVSPDNTGTSHDSLSEAPNNGGKNPSQTIQGQTGTNQTQGGSK